MGVDARLYAHKPMLTAQMAMDDSRRMRIALGELCQRDTENGDVLFFSSVAPFQMDIPAPLVSVDIRSGRYYDQSCKRGCWPEIYLKIRWLQLNGYQVFYGNDCAEMDCFGTLVTRDYLEDVMRHWASDRSSEDRI